MIDIFSKIENIQINCLAQNQEKFKILSFKIPNKKYKIKIIVLTFSIRVTASAGFVKQRRNEIYGELSKYKLHNHSKSIQRCDWRRKYRVNLNTPIQRR